MAYNFDKQETWTVESPVNMETSYGVIDSSEKETLHITVGVDSEAEYGFFEIYDEATQGDRFYGEGGLWFDGKELTDYDGVFELSQYVIDKLKEWGFDTSEIEL
jgi:hypothetical protein